MRQYRWHATRQIAVIAMLVAAFGCDDVPDETPDPTPDQMIADIGPDVGGDMAPAADMAPGADMARPADMAPAADAGPDEGIEADMAPEADAGPRPEWTSSPCADATHVGGFEIALQAGFTSVQGQVADGVVPREVPVIDAEAGECQLLRPPSLFCEPGCGVGETCGPDGCIAQPGNVFIGPVRVAGLTAPVELEARAPVYFYSFRGDLPHPAFAEGDVITLTGDGVAVDGGDDIPPFTLRGEGIAPLSVMGQVLPVESGSDAVLAWDPPAGPGPAQVHIELNIANHGGTPARIECMSDDDGDFAIPAALIDRLLELGYSGFPSVVLTRRTVDQTAIPAGCIELRVESAAALDVEIDGLTSCSVDDDCPDGQTCQPDLTCG